MTTKSPSLLHAAIADLAEREQVPLTADALPGIGTPTAAPRSIGHSDDRLYVRLGVPVPVKLQTVGDNIHMRADWERMYWGVYTAVAMGIRKLLAARLGVECKELDLHKLLVVEPDHATQFVEVVVPKQLADAFNSPDTQDEVKTFLHIVKGRELPEDSAAYDASTSGLTHEVDGLVPQPLSIAKRIAHEVREAAGGKTLPAACSIDAPGWEAPMKLEGKLGDKPPKASGKKPEKITLTCLVDGYVKSQRVVHLLPLTTNHDKSSKRIGDGRKVVAFKEEAWLAEIAALAAAPGLTACATYLEVDDGGKARLHLLNIERIDADKVVALNG